MIRRDISVAISLLLMDTALAAAQPNHNGKWMAGTQAAVLATRAEPAVGGNALTEGYISQPTLMAHLTLLGGSLEATGTANFEGATIRGGELNAGIFGEGYVDRRHPHTYVHELMLTARIPLARNLSISAGKGFAPFGTDDPMMRPFVKYPVNHHLAQILERAVVVGAIRRGRVQIEVGAFNGDEPEAPEDWPNWDRFGDSWSARATIAPLSGIEGQGSYAEVASPEWATGFGPDQKKRSTSARYERAPSERRRSYALLEWARTDEYANGERSFGFHSVLGEAALRRRGLELAARYERTTRPEEERLNDPFRSQRPHDDNNILGVTRWDIASAAMSVPLALPNGIGARPFVEIARHRAVEERRPSAFVPRDFYGSDRLWSISAGFRLSAGMPHSRMGRYGAANAGGHGGMLH